MHDERQLDWVRPLEEAAARERAARELAADVLATATEAITRAAAFEPLTH